MRRPTRSRCTAKPRLPNEVPAAITLHDGPMYAATVLSETLAAAGVNCQQPARRDRTLRAAMAKAVAAGDKSWQVIAVHETPLPQVLARANKDSMNLYGECLCKRLGAEVSGQPGSWGQRHRRGGIIPHQGGRRPRHISA